MLKVFRIAALVICVVVGWAGLVAAQEKAEAPVYNMIKELQEKLQKRAKEPPPPPLTEAQLREKELIRCSEWLSQPQLNTICRVHLEIQGYRPIKMGIANVGFHGTEITLMKYDENFAICAGLEIFPDSREVLRDFDHCTKLSEPPK